MPAHTLHITNNTIRFGERVYSVPNITQIDVATEKRMPKIGSRTLAACGLLLALCYLYPTLPLQIYAGIAGKPAPPALLGALVLSLAALCLYGLVDRTRLKFYTLVIETSGRSASLFSSRSRDVIMNVAAKIGEAMENPSKALAYHVNVGDIITTTGNGNNVTNKSRIDRSPHDH